MKQKFDWEDRYFSWRLAMQAANARALEAGVRQQVRRIDNWLGPCYKVTEAGPREV